ncbi:hypothetical protein B0T17DRAFT_540460 [Bombardia bombarda]|uniref:Uncharacterized protein n=1 Tax=Bombardia bombarda TaxID=252184 RepID=A0AA39WGC0_9PEZI|nr:hypothetical protein B0T17DRAFT_540460 [Bombardia bombarda]
MCRRDSRCSPLHNKLSIIKSPVLLYSIFNNKKFRNVTSKVNQTGFRGGRDGRQISFKK